MPKKIFSVGYHVPSDEIEYITLTSKRSLLEADIILFSPFIDGNCSGDTQYQDKRLLSHINSKIWKDVTNHWKREINSAAKAGKLVIIMLPSPVEVFTYTGNAEVTGTGRGRKSIDVVAILSSFNAIPIKFNYEIAEGQYMKLDTKAGVFSSFWSKFSELARYYIYLTPEILENGTTVPLLWTKKGDRIVGCFNLHDQGALVMLPYIDFNIDDFLIEQIEENETEEYWTEEAIKLGHEFVLLLNSLDDSIKSESTKTPTPEWALTEDFQFKKEKYLLKKIENFEEQISQIESEKSLAISELEIAGELRGLLFAQGRTLENSILEALKLFGFQAETYDDGENEFDAVFLCEEGRCLGEAEGKDSKSINVKKFSQLERKIAEDFEREGVDEHAKGVMFGNPHRLIIPKERNELFTTKCISASNRIGAALIHTPDMFEPARYLKENDDMEFAKNCKEAILNTKGGIVVFPEIPPIKKTSK